jgi:hypothetical protein
LLDIYIKLLLLYPRSFQNEFAEEMQVVFKDSVRETSRDGMFSLAILCLIELGGLPFNILREFWHEFERKEAIMVTNEKVESGSTVNRGTSYWDALIGTSPFALFGIASMLSRTQYPFNTAYTYPAFYAAVLLGLLIGMIKGFPRWAYSYLGWCMVMAWWWMSMPVFRFNDPTYAMRHNQLISWWSWTPFLITLGIGLLLARSIHPIYNMIQGVWQDWTLLSLAIYAFVAFASLIYDENHHPYLFAFIAATTIAVCLVVWEFMKSDSSWKRVVSLLAGFVIAFVLSNISYATQNYAGYYNLPPSPPQAWYTKAFDGIISWTVLYSGIMYWPALIGLVRHIINNRQKPGMAA